MGRTIPTWLGHGDRKETVCGCRTQGEGPEGLKTEAASSSGFGSRSPVSVTGLPQGFTEELHLLTSRMVLSSLIENLLTGQDTSPPMYPSGPGASSGSFLSAPLLVKSERLPYSVTGPVGSAGDGLEGGHPACARTWV